MAISIPEAATFASSECSKGMELSGSVSDRGLLRGVRAAAATVLALGLLLVIVLPPSSSRAAYTVEAGISYSDQSPADPSRNQLDLYRPSSPASTLAPIVIYVHGGGWRRGDKANGIVNKARLFTDAGYFFASLNYRLSPETGDPNNPDPNRIRFPVHPQDVGRAIAWLSNNALERGIDPDRMILIGHSAGAHLVSLVSTDPRYISPDGVDQAQLLGTIPLDTAAFDIERAVNRGTDPDEENLLFINAFGTAAENAAEGSWQAASPLAWADPGDPEHLFIVQSVFYRIAESQEMATALGQGSEAVVSVARNHNQINQAVGAPGDSSGVTTAIESFVSARLAAYQAPSVEITRRPTKVITVRRGVRDRRPVTRNISFSFQGSGVFGSVECRLDAAPFRTCTSPRRYRVGRGGHTFRVRPVYPSGRPGTEQVFGFRVISRKIRR